MAPNTSLVLGHGRSPLALALRGDHGIPITEEGKAVTVPPHPTTGSMPFSFYQSGQYFLYF
jgi:hypothetical protein